MRPLRFTTPDLPRTSFGSTEVSSGNFMDADLGTGKFIAAPGTNTLSNVSLTHSAQTAHNSFTQPSRGFIPSPSSSREPAEVTNSFVSPATNSFESIRTSRRPSTIILPNVMRNSSPYNSHAAAPNPPTKIKDTLETNSSGFSDEGVNDGFE
jgi:hypothetical protein